MKHEARMIMKTIIDKVKDDPLKLFELNPRNQKLKQKQTHCPICSHTTTAVDDVYRKA